MTGASHRLIGRLWVEKRSRPFLHPREAAHHHEGSWGRRSLRITTTDPGARVETGSSPNGANRRSASIAPCHTWTSSGTLSLETTNAGRTWWRGRALRNR
jgi:hypothetical protein